MPAADRPREASPPPKRRKRRRRVQAAVAIGLAGLGLAGLQFASDQCWLGLGSCPDGPPDIRIDTASSVFNASSGDDPADEYVCIVNASGEQIELAGWQLREGGGDVVNTLPSFAFAPDSKIRVHPGEGRNSNSDLFGTSGAPVWNNDVDSVTLVDAGGEQIASVSYGVQDEEETAAPCD